MNKKQVRELRQAVRDKHDKEGITFTVMANVFGISVTAMKEFYYNASKPKGTTLNLIAIGMNKFEGLQRWEFYEAQRSAPPSECLSVPVMSMRWCNADPVRSTRYNP